MVEKPSKQGLLCPVCRVDLVMSDRQGVEIDYCPQCRGVWLDRGELDKIIERSAPEDNRPTLDSGSFDRGRDGHHGGREHGDYGKRRRKGFFRELFD